MASDADLHVEIERLRTLLMLTVTILGQPKLSVGTARAPLHALADPRCAQQGPGSKAKSILQGRLERIPVILHNRHERRS